MDTASFIKHTRKRYESGRMQAAVIVHLDNMIELANENKWRELGKKAGEVVETCGILQGAEFISENVDD